METPLTSIVERINRALEFVVAPEVTSPIVRGQLLAVVELLNQLQGRFGYRHDFLVQDIDRAREILAVLVDALAVAGVEIPPEIASAPRSVELLGATEERLRAERAAAESAVSAALDLLDAHRDAIADAGRVEAVVLDRLQPGIQRDLMLFRPPRFDKISQRVDEGDP